MMKYTILVAAAITLLAGCNAPATDNTTMPASVWTCTQDSFIAQSPWHITPGGDSSSAVYEIRSLTISGGDATVAQAINQTIKNYLLNEIMLTEEPTTYKTFEEASKALFSEFAAIAKEVPDMPIEHSVDASVSCGYTNGKTLSVNSSTYLYMGGAHPNTVLRSFNFDLKTGKDLTLAEVVDTTALMQVALPLFMTEYATDENGKPVKSLTEAGFFDDKLTLPTNFSIEEKGLQLIWGNYEIAPYVMGTQTLLVPYDKLQGALKR